MTGSGKTLAFVVPIVELLLKSPCKARTDIGAIIISPTRELAQQTMQVVHELVVDTPITSLLLTGGNTPSEDVERLNRDGCNVIVATPGRLEDMFKRVPHMHAAARALEMLVLDEADRLLELGFEASLNAIIAYLPKQRRTVRGDVM